jgi:hypothetical protein
MAEQFERRNLIITLCQKGVLPVLSGGEPKLHQVVEVNVLGKNGRWEQAELPAEDFFSLLYKEVFPALSRRIFPRGRRPKL